MNGKEALEYLKREYEYLTLRDEELFDIIEQDLKALDIFKNALTIEHHEYSQVKIDPADDSVVGLVKQLYQIKQNEIDKDMRKALREWVLKNAFPKEMKMLDVIKDTFKISVYHSRHTETGYEMSIEDYNPNGNIVFCDITKEQFDAVEEVLCPKPTH